MPDGVAEDDGDLAVRLTRLTALRLVVWTLLLGFVTLVYLRGQTDGFSSIVAFGTVSASYALSGVYAFVLRQHKHLRTVAYAQIVSDQLAWTALVYVTGGATSGGVSLYGLTCLTSAIVLGYRGGATALAVALTSYLGLAGLLTTGLLARPSDQPADAYVLGWSDAAYPMLANSVGLVVVTVLASYLAERLRVAGGDLRAARRRARDAEQLALLGQLAAGLAHEIRNPLGSISGSVELLRSSPGLDAEDRQLCDIVQRETARLNELIGDMLELSRPREPVMKSVEVAGLAREVVTLASKSGRGADVGVRYEGADEASIKADPAQLRQVLWNLVRNAVQASSAGDEVVVLVAPLEDQGLCLEVLDQGPGVPEDQLERLFDAFHTTRTHGTGIGLAVVKRIVEAHQFVLEVESEPGKGATFRVRVPRSKVVTGRRSTAPSVPEGLPTGPSPARG